MLSLPWRLAVLAVLCLAVLPAAAQPRPTVSDTALSERRVAYVQDVRLDPAARTVAGTQRVTWRNPDQVPVDELQFHLYLNAFSGPYTTFMQASGGSHRGQHAGSWGGIEVGDITVAEGPGAGADLQLRFLHPDGNLRDSTVAAVTLPEPVAPGETVTLDMAFTSTLPEVFARTGWLELHDGRPFFLVAQWFPKLGVYEVPGQRYVPGSAERGAWSTHAFHANTEFYADFGTYDVTLTVPQDYRVGATGVRTAEAEGDTTRTLTYRAEDVVDFAWTTSPALEVYEDQWEHVDLRLLLLPQHADQVERHFDAVKLALENLDAWVGPYPYTTLTVVDGIGGAGGMEYPTFITAGTTYRMPSWLRMPELVTIHEAGHQYFQSIVASNEAEEAWLDEGITSYVEARIMDEAYPEGAVVDLPGFGLSDFGMHYTQYAIVPSRVRMVQEASAYAFGDYGTASYSKPATVLLTLERLLGWEAMQEVLHTYYRRWAFRHPTTRDFQDVVQEVAFRTQGDSLGWFFEQYVYGTAVVDYAVHRLATTRQADDSYESEVVVHRREDGTFPQTLQVTFADGTQETVRWDGQDAWKAFTFTSDAALTEAWLDPENTAWLDANHLNDRRTRHADETLAAKQQAKTTTFLQHLLIALTGVL